MVLKCFYFKYNVFGQCSKLLHKTPKATQKNFFTKILTAFGSNFHVCKLKKVTQKGLREIFFCVPEVKAYLLFYLWRIMFYISRLLSSEKAWKESRWKRKKNSLAFDISCCLFDKRKQSRREKSWKSWSRGA